MQSSFSTLIFLNSIHFNSFQYNPILLLQIILNHPYVDVSHSSTPAPQSAPPPQVCDRGARGGLRRWLLLLASRGGSRALPALCPNLPSRQDRGSRCKLRGAASLRMITFPMETLDRLTPWWPSRSSS